MTSGVSVETGHIRYEVVTSQEYLLGWVNSLPTALGRSVEEREGNLKSQVAATKASVPYTSMPGGSQIEMQRDSEVEMQEGLG